MDVFCCLPRSLISRAAVIRAVRLDPHLAYERVLPDFIHAVAPPVCLDKLAWPFIIPLVIPELPARYSYLHDAKETGIQI